MTPGDRSSPSLVEHGEQFSAGRDRRVIVTRLATRWFVLEGFTVAPVATYTVHGPWLRRESAIAAALAMHERIVAHERMRVRLLAVEGA